MTYQPTFRDRVAHRVANAALRCASKPYRDFINLVVTLGRNEFDHMAREAAK